MNLFCIFEVEPKTYCMKLLPNRVVSICNCTVFSSAFFCLIFSFITTAVYSQSLSYGESLSAGSINAMNFNQVSWQICEDGEEIAQGKGSTFYQYVFDRPGYYVLEFDVPEDQQGHSHENTESQEYHYSGKCLAFYGEAVHFIKVDPFKIIYDCSGMSLSKPITGNKPVIATQLLIPVEVKGQAIRPARMIQSQGVGTTITGTLKKRNQQVLQPGKHVLVYQLSGQARKNTYIQFLFVNTNNEYIDCGINAMIQ